MEIPIRSIEDSKVLISKSHNRFFLQLQSKEEEEEGSAVKRVSEPDSKDVDVLIITAAAGEQEALLKCRDSDGESLIDATNQWHRRKFKNDPYYYRYFTDKDGKPIKIASVDTLEQGQGQAMASAIKFRDLNPKCIAIVGICAGDHGRVNLGDIIIAERLFPVRKFDYTDGYKITSSWVREAKNYERKDNYLKWQAHLELERPLSYECQSKWLLYALLMHESNSNQNLHPGDHPDTDKKCPNYSEIALSLLKEKLISRNQEGRFILEPAGRSIIRGELELYRNNISDLLGKEPSSPSVFLRPVGTGADLIEEDDFFPRMREQCKQPYAVAYDMEGYAVAQAAWTENVDKMIFVKSVSDFAGSKRRNPHFRDYACSASATFLIHFLKNHLSELNGYTDE